VPVPEAVPRPASPAPRTRYTFFIDADAREALATIMKRDSVNESALVRRLIRE
jgi:hypothetical protein